MKSLCIFLIFIVLLGGLSACSDSRAAIAENDKITIISTIFPPYDFARNIAGDRAEISLLLPPSADSHFYEPTPNDIIRVREADVFLYIGGASDKWTEKILTADNKSKVLKLTDTVSLLEGDGHVHGDEVYYDEFDEHIWTSPRNAVLMTQAICDALCETDPKNAEFYRENTAEYIKELQELDSRFYEIAENSPCNTLIFADRFAFKYLTEQYGFEYHAAFPNCNEQAEPSAQMLSFLIEKIEAEKIPVILYGELSDKRTANSISRETGAEPMLIHSCHTLSEEEINAGIGYIEIMQNNAKVIEKALS